MFIAMGGTLVSVFGMLNSEAELHFTFNVLFKQLSFFGEAEDARCLLEFLHFLTGVLSALSWLPGIFLKESVCIVVSAVVTATRFSPQHLSLSLTSRLSGLLVCGEIGEREGQ